MDECRFDNWTRMLGALQDRRAALWAVLDAARGDAGPLAPAPAPA